MRLHIVLVEPEIPSNTGNPVLDANLYDLAQRFNGGHSPETVLQMLSTAINIRFICNYFTSTFALRANCFAFV